MVSLKLDGMFVPVAVEDALAKHAFACNCVDAREIANLGSAGRVRKEVFPAWADGTRCSGVHDERRSHNGRIVSEGRIQENRK